MSPNRSHSRRFAWRPDGSGFIRDGKPFVPIGVTYFRPHTGWAPQVWKRFDPEATREDFQPDEGAGRDGRSRLPDLSGRSFSRPTGWSPSGLAKLDSFLEIAEEAGIYVHPTGPEHWEGTPGWAEGDRYADEDLLKAQEVFWSALAARYRGRSVIWAYDLLNEPEIRWDGQAMAAKWNQWLETTYKTPQGLAAAWGVPLNEIQFGAVSVPRPRSARRGRCCVIISISGSRLPAAGPAARSQPSVPQTPRLLSRSA